MVAFGEKAWIHYRGTLDDGREFDSSYRYGAPLEILVGLDDMLPGLKEALRKMEPGDTYTVRIPPEEAYGFYDESLIEKVPFDLFPGAERLSAGKRITVKLPSGEISVKVASIEDGVILLDHNHELAGQALNFEIKLVTEDDAVCDGAEGDVRCGSWSDFERIALGK